MFKNKLIFINEFNALFFLLSMIFIISILGQIMAFHDLYNEFVIKHIIKIFFSFVFLIIIYSIDYKFWNSFAYILYCVAFMFLIFVYFIGVCKLGAQRWLNVYLFSFQPSELMKICLILALSRYYSDFSFIERQNIKNHFIPFLLTLIPALLIIKQPDLGTGFLLIGIGVSIIFISGFPMKTFVCIAGGICLLCPCAWFFLHDYQKNRIYTFLNPESDPLGIGYHVLQSKIAIGSGGFCGKGILKGTQSKLNFLPEKNTDFIFTTISEEIGFIGSCTILIALLMLIYYCLWIAKSRRLVFSKLTCLGISMLFFLHTFINIAMVIGVVPIVGIPLPFLSYGGSSLFTFMFAVGILMSALTYKKSI